MNNNTFIAMIIAKNTFYVNYNFLSYKLKIMLEFYVFSPYIYDNRDKIRNL